jgi:Tfp pilus assembly protein PilF
MVKTEAQATQEQNIKLADRYYQKAREYLHEKDYHNCIQFCRLAIKFNTQSAPFHALMAEALAKNPNTKWQKMAEDAYQTACDLDPWNAEYRVALGVFYQNQGLGIRARKQFEKALEILPTHAVAKAALKGRGR